MTNLFAYPTDDAPAISVTGRDEGGWLDARADIKSTILSADFVPVGWGLGGGIVGTSAVRFREQIDWVVDELAAAGHLQVWAMGT